MQLVLTESHRNILSKLSKDLSPNESCAILFGKDNLVSEVFLTKNIEESSVNFTISNEQLIEGYKIAEERKVEVIGVFHSHPNSDAYPSNTDKKFMHSNPVVWIIYSGINKDFKAYFLESDIIKISIEEK